MSHIAFFEEKKKKPLGAGLIPWINLAMSYCCLILGLGSFLLLLINPTAPLEATIAKAGQSPGDETDGEKFHLAIRQMLHLGEKGLVLEIAAGVKG